MTAWSGQRRGGQVSGATLSTVRSRRLSWERPISTTCRIPKLGRQRLGRWASCRRRGRCRSGRVSYRLLDGRLAGSVWGSRADTGELVGAVQDGRPGDDVEPKDQPERAGWCGQPVRLRCGCGALGGVEGHPDRWPESVAGGERVKLEGSSPRRTGARRRTCGICRPTSTTTTSTVGQPPTGRHPVPVRFPASRRFHRCTGSCPVTSAGRPTSRYRSGPVRVKSGWDELIRPPANAGL